MNDDLRDNEKLYGERDPMAQDEAGGYFARHMHHMTTENLHSKAEIAEELAHRDIQIEAKDQRIAELIEELDNERARGIHSCGPHCKRPLCLANKRIAELERVVEIAREFCTESLNQPPYCNDVFPYDLQEAINNLAPEDTRKEASDE